MSAPKFNILQKPPTDPGDEKGWYRWYYKVCELLNVQPEIIDVDAVFGPVIHVLETYNSQYITRIGASAKVLNVHVPDGYSFAAGVITDTISGNGKTVQYLLSDKVFYRIG